MSCDVKALFFQVTHKALKPKKIIQLAQEHFDKKEALLIRLPNQQSVEYVDLLLWRSPVDSFLPHIATQKRCSDLIVLTQHSTNLNGAKKVLNLCPEPIIEESSLFLKIYEFEDLSSTHNHQQAQIKYKAYKEKGFSIISLGLN